ncbi:hypothetical protein Y032_0027g1618 [Ancylostoma ceylanicum]|uniref:Uncharacterized protein n=1 Tax=Ancylostoma ceylanicum TaxID=53326 RepID=A0A016UV07_9BILA|nr:hypothetical protein Y032_0027g1618 [Ancylostoma ceylanicum]
MRKSRKASDASQKTQWNLPVMVVLAPHSTGRYAKYAKRAKQRIVGVHVCRSRRKIIVDSVAIRKCSAAELRYRSTHPIRQSQISAMPFFPTIALPFRKLSTCAKLNVA